MNRVGCIKPRLADDPPPVMPDGMVLTLPEFMSRGQLGAIRDTLDHLGSAASYTDTAVNVDPWLELAQKALTVAVREIEARS